MLVSYPKAAYVEAVKLAEYLAEAECEKLRTDFWNAQIGGFFAGLRCCLEPEAIRVIIMAHDEALEKFRAECKVSEHG